MNQWDALVSAALVGTERRAVQPTEVAGIGPPAGPTPDAAAALLSAASLLVAQRRAGRRPAHRELPPASPSDDQPLVALAARHRLAGIIAGQHTAVLPEWLAAASRCGLGVPGHLLPALLERARGDKSIRGLVHAVGGSRARWLAGLNHDWAFLLDEAAGEAGDADPHVWEFGDSGQRRDYLANLRAKDPDQAREQLSATWRQETPQDRAALLALFHTGLAAGDEPFLEAALDDRRREVREIAADLLVQLPDSALARRMAERAVACLSVQRRVRGNRLVVDPPGACDAAMQRDGIHGRPPAGVGDRAWWLQELLARTPLAIWTGRLGRTADQIVAIKPADGWRTTLIAGWARAAVSQHDQDWARALLGHGPPGPLLAVLPSDERTRRAARIVVDANLDRRLVDLLTGIDAPWLGDFATAVLDKIAQATKVDPWLSGRLCQLAALRLAPDLAHQADRLVDEPTPQLQRLTATLHFRHDMLKELE